MKRKARKLVGTPLRATAVFMGALSSASMREERVLKPGMGGSVRDDAGTSADLIARFTLLAAGIRYTSLRHCQALFALRGMARHGEGSNAEPESEKGRRADTET